MTRYNTCPNHPGRIRPCEKCEPEKRAALRAQRHLREVPMETTVPSIVDENPQDTTAVDPETPVSLDEESAPPQDFDGPAHGMECIGDYDTGDDTCAACDYQGECRLAEPSLAPSLEDLPSTCDWGGCDSEAVSWRWDPGDSEDFGHWLPVCAEHEEPKAEETYPPDIYHGLSGPAEPYQPTLDDRVFGGYQLRSVKVTVSGSFSVPLQDLQAWAAQSNPLKLGRDAEITLQAVIDQATLSAKGTSVAGALRIRATDLLKLHVQETAYIMAEKAETAGEDDDDDDYAAAQDRPDLEAAADALLGEGEAPQEETLPFPDVDASSDPDEPLPDDADELTDPEDREYVGDLDAK